MSDDTENAEEDALFARVPAALLFLMAVLAIPVWISYSQIHKDERIDASSHKEKVTVAECVSPDFSNAIECLRQAADSEYDQTAEWYDLKAQQDMAKWALLMFVVTSVGVGYIALTLHTTSETLEEARNTTRAAVDGAAAAWKTEESTREIGQKQATAYLYATSANVPVRQTLTHGVDNALLSALQKRAMLSVKLRNIGQTMAKNVYLKFELCDEQNRAWETHRELKDFKSLRTSNIAPGQDFDVIIYQDILKDIRESAASEDRLEYPLQMRTLRGDIIYEDVFTNIFRTAFIFVLFYDITKEEAPKEEMPCLLMPNNAPAFEKVGVEHYNDS
ncbi:hypothetical protein [Hyphomonas sp.]|uniref:hypothetical protein n=1 Tax=Hyphomonas sp. TaxID=87 RepID=UPI003002280C